MKKLFYVLAFILIAISVFFNVSAYAGGAGGSWGDDSGFGGNGGSFGGGGAGSSPSSQCEIDGQYVSGQQFCDIYYKKGFWDWPTTFNGDRCIGKSGTTLIKPNCSPPQCPSGSNLVGGKCIKDCPIDYHDEGGVCVKDLKCPAGYLKTADNTCVWQCPAGFKMVGGNCVKDDQPEDCDPTIQQCDDDGQPQCDPCSKLQQLINNNLTMINNDNRVISLTENIVTTMNTTNNNINNVNTSINNVNTNISNVNNNLTTINESIQNVITSIENNKPDFDTSGIESKLQQLIDKQITVDSANIEMDFTPLISKLEELNQSIIANKYDDTELKLKIDELINKDLSAITDRQDEQTSLLEDIKRLLMPTNEAGDPSLDLPEVEESSFDPWGAIRGFNINQNIINASSQCPADKSFTINLLVKSVTFAIPMNPMCSFLGYLAPVFLALAYFQGAMIILKAGD